MPHPTRGRIRAKAEGFPQAVFDFSFHIATHGENIYVESMRCLVASCSQRAGERCELKSESFYKAKV